MPPAARVTDFHACPMVTPGLPPLGTGPVQIAYEYHNPPTPSTDRVDFEVRRTGPPPTADTGVVCAVLPIVQCEAEDKRNSQLSELQLADLAELARSSVARYENGNAS